MLPIRKTLKALSYSQYLKPKNLFHLIRNFCTHNQNLIAILSYQKSIQPTGIAFTYDEESINYNELYNQVLSWSYVLENEYSLISGDKVAIISHNNANFIKAICALSGLGVDTFLLNADLSIDQISSQISTQKFKLIITDENWEQKIDFGKINLNSIEQKAQKIENPRQYRTKKFKKSGHLTMMSGGSSGSSKWAQRQPNISSFIHPFIALVHDVQLYKYKRLLLQLPIYHGFGAAALIMCIVLGKTFYLRNPQSSEDINSFIQKNDIDIITLVPTILQKIIDSNIPLPSLQCIISGGAPINPQLVQYTLKNFGPILYNLYGTSEAGVSTIATPQDLLRHPDSIGKIIKGIKYKITQLPEINLPKGILEINCAWSMISKAQWISTGDIVNVDKDGYIFLHGRHDQMIISGGMNVHPEEIESICKNNSRIRDIKLLPIEDARFGKSLIAFIVSPLSIQELNEWMKEHLAPYQRPKKIFLIKEIPYFENGKLNASLLIKKANCETTQI